MKRRILLKIGLSSILYFSFTFCLPVFAETTPSLVKEIVLDSPVQGSVLSVVLDKSQHPVLVIAEMDKGLRVVGDKINWTKDLKVGRATPSAGDLDGDGKLEIVIPVCDAPNKCSILILSSEGSVQKEFPIQGEVKGSVVIKDVDGDGLPELIYATVNGYLGVLNSVGQSLKNFPKKLDKLIDSSESLYTPTPAVGNLDGDLTNGDEIVVVTNGGKMFAYHSNGQELPAFPIQLKGAVFASPLMGDLDGDGYGEIITVTGNGYVDVIRPNGASLKGFPFHVKGPVVASPVVVDFHKNKKQSIFVATQTGYVMGISFEGKILEGWPRFVKNKVTASPLVADINGDFEPDLVVATQSGGIYAFNPLGHSIEGYPFQIQGKVYATPVVMDWNKNAKASLVIATQDKKLLVLEDPRVGIASVYKNNLWATFQGNVARTGSFGGVSKISILTPSKRLEEPTNTPVTTPNAPNITPEDLTPKKSNGCSSLPENGVPLWPLALLSLFFFFSRKQKRK